MTPKMTQEEVIQLWREEEIEIDGVVYRTHEEGEWEQDDKFQFCDIIFTDGTKFYRASISRSGSPFTDWHYEDWGTADIDEVEQKEVITTAWVTV